MRTLSFLDRAEPLDPQALAALNVPHEQADALLRSLQSQVHSAALSDELWGPLCAPALRWSVPLVGSEGLSALTCPACHRLLATAQSSEPAR